MPDAVRLVADEREWGLFQEWQAKPKPMVMLDQDGRFPEVPHELADELFGRLISKLKNGELSAIGFRDDETEHTLIPAIFWATHWYNIWFNLLVDLGRGKVAFGSICVGAPVAPVEVTPKQTLRKAMKDEVKAWVNAHPGEQVTKAALQEAVLATLTKRFPGSRFSENMFNEIWRDVPKPNKFTSNPGWAAGKGAEKN